MGDMESGTLSRTLINGRVPVLRSCINPLLHSTIVPLIVI